jgi:hypothetical protein
MKEKIMQAEIDKDAFIEACEAAGLTGFRTDYSGRHMYGQLCIGIVGDAGDWMTFVADVASKFPELGKEWRNVRQDNMGKDYIWYWPNIQIVESAPVDRHGVDKRYDESDSDGFKIVD